MGLQRRLLLHGTDRQPPQSQTRGPNHAEAPSIGIGDCSVYEDKQRIRRIRLTTERIPAIWRWHVDIHLTGGLPMGSAQDLETAKAEFAAAWKELKARTSPEDLSPPTGP